MFAALRPWLSTARADDGRWVVLDVESSGLDPARDRLLSIAAVAVHVDLAAAGASLQLVPADSFEIVLQQPAAESAPDKANILVHGLGVGAQQAGVAPAAALQAFMAWAGAAPLIGYHVGFDRELLERAERRLGLRPARRRRWLDLAELVPLLRPGLPGRALDDSLAAFGIHCLARHQAAADAWATAELLLCLWPLARQQHGAAPGFAALQRLAAARRWLGA